MEELVKRVEVRLPTGIWGDFRVGPEFGVILVGLEVIEAQLNWVFLHVGNRTRFRGGILEGLG